MAEYSPQYSFQYGYFAHNDDSRTYRVQFSPNGSLLGMAITGTAVAHIITPTALATPWRRQFIGHTDFVTDLSFSSDSRLLATSSLDSTIRLWDVNGFHVRRFTTDHNLRDHELCVKFNPESNMIASGSSADSVRIWDVNSGSCLKVLPAHPGFIPTLDYSPDGSLIVAGTFGGLCRIWDTSAGNALMTIKEPGHPPVGSVKFSSDGKFVLVGLMDSTLRIWSMDRGGMLPTIYVGHENTKIQILSTFIGANEKFILSGSEDNSLYIWEVMFRKPFQRIDQAHTAPVLSVSFHPTMDLFASSSRYDTNTVKVWKNNLQTRNLFQ